MKSTHQVLNEAMGRSRVALIRRVANTADDEIFKFNSGLSADKTTQLDDYKARIRAHALEELGSILIKRIDAFDSAVEDSCTALNGIARASFSQQPPITGENAANIARNSYTVLKVFARNPGLADTTAKDKSPGYDWYIDDSDLELVPNSASGATNAHFRIKLKVIDPNAEVVCPAFKGMLPKLMWDGLINIYEACGEFEPKPVGTSPV